MYILNIHSDNPELNVHHYTVIFPTDAENSRNILLKSITIGINTDITFGNMPSKHSEVDALNKIKYRRNNPKSVSMFVIRLSKTGVLGESRPCYHCLQTMLKSRLNIKYIYYSTATGLIIREELCNMLQSVKTYISWGVKDKNKNRYLNNKIKKVVRTKTQKICYV